MKNVLKTVRTLLMGFTLFSCSTEEGSEETSTSDSIEIEVLSADFVFNEILNPNTNELINSSNEATTLTSTNSSKLTFTMDEYYGLDHVTRERVCTTDFHDLGGNGENSILSSSSRANFFLDVSDPYIPYNNVHGAFVEVRNPENTTFFPYEVNRILFIDPDTNRSFNRYEIEIETNDVIRISATAAAEVWTTDIAGFNGNPSNHKLSDVNRVNIYLRDFDTDRLISIIAEDAIYPNDSDGLTYKWKVPSTIPSGEYYIQIVDSENSTITTNENFIVQILLENNGEASDQLSILRGDESIIQSPVRLNPFTISASTTNTVTKTIPVEWDRDTFDESFVRIQMSTIDPDNSNAIELVYNEWVRNNGSHIIPEEIYKTRNYAAVQVRGVETVGITTFNFLD